MISSISIQNFKSIKKADSELPIVGAVVGKNAAGKTNILQAISFIKSLAAGESANAIFKKIALTPQEIFHYNESSNDLLLSVQVSNVLNNKYTYEVTISVNNDALSSLFIKQETLYSVAHDDDKQIVYRRENSALTDREERPIPLAVEPDKAAVSLYQDENVLAFKNIFYSGRPKLHNHIRPLFPV